MNKDIDKLLRQAEKLGCIVELHRHIKVRCPNGRIVVMSPTPSDVRAIRNARARLRTIGELAI